MKDFGDSIPGHGGLTDRMDCQVIMAVFANIYYNTAVKEAVNTVASVLQIVRCQPLRPSQCAFKAIRTDRCAEDGAP